MPPGSRRQHGVDGAHQRGSRCDARQQERGVSALTFRGIEIAYQACLDVGSEPLFMLVNPMIYDMIAIGGWLDRQSIILRPFKRAYRWLLRNGSRDEARFAAERLRASRMCMWAVDFEVTP